MSKALSSFMTFVVVSAAFWLVAYLLFSFPNGRFDPQAGLIVNRWDPIWGLLGIVAAGLVLARKRKKAS
jgi:LPXTG-motif cell wall-anchored protein